MNNDIRDQVYNSMKLKETDELIDIWQKHNSSEWTDVAFEVVAEILRERLGEIPSPDELDEDKDGEDILDGKVASSSNTKAITSKMEIVGPRFWLEKQNVIALAR